MNKKGEVKPKDFFEVGFPALVVFFSIFLLHSSYWVFGVLGFVVCFFIWIKGKEEEWNSLAVAFLISGVVEIVLSNTLLGGLWVAVAIVVFLLPRW